MDPLLKLVEDLFLIPKVRRRDRGQIPIAVMVQPVVNAALLETPSQRPPSIGTDRTPPAEDPSAPGREIFD